MLENSSFLYLNFKRKYKMELVQNTVCYYFLYVFYKNELKQTVESISYR